MPETTNSTEQTFESKRPRSVDVAKDGINTSRDFIRLMSATIGDVLDGQVTAQVAGVVVGAGRNILKAAELQLRYGSPNEVGEQNIRLLN